MANSTSNYDKKMVKRKLRKQNIIKYATLNVMGIAHKEEMDSVLNEKQIKNVAITESKKKFKGTM